MLVSTLHVWRKRKQTSAKLCLSFSENHKSQLIKWEKISAAVCPLMFNHKAGFGCVICHQKLHISKVFIMSSGFMYRPRGLSWQCCLSLCLILSLLASYRCQEAAAGSWTRLSWRTYRGRSRWEGQEESLGMRGRAYFPSTERRRVWVYS